LWSGDWRLDSAAAAEELARRRAEVPEPAGPPEPEPPPKRGAAARVAERLRAMREDIAAALHRWREGRGGFGRRLAGALRRHRTSLLAVLGTLLVAVVAFGAVSLLAGSGDNGSKNGGGPPGYLGVEMAGTPFSFQGSGSGFPFANGVMVVNVIPGSPAAAAGIEPGDVITNVDNKPVTTPAQVNAAIARLHAGDRVQIQYVQSFTTYTTQATLTRPPGSP
jgi:PDZ domain-containing protein